MNIVVFQQDVKFYYIRLDTSNMRLILKNNLIILMLTKCKKKTDSLFIKQPE